MKTAEYEEYLEDILMNPGFDEYCPNCGQLYNCVDFDYQICGECKYDNN